MIKVYCFLPYSCPKVENLFIEGQISSFNFLYHFNQLSSCEIRSVDDSIGYYQIYNPHLTNQKERDEILAHSDREIKSEMDVHLAIFDKLNKIMQALNIIGFSYEEQEIYLNKKIPTLFLEPNKEFVVKKLESYYIYEKNNREMKLSSVPIELDIITNDRLYSLDYQIDQTYIKSKKQIIESKPFIYHPSGIPIVFCNGVSNRQDYIDRAVEIKETFILKEEKPYEKTK